jgi:hypothetical protein
MVTQPRPAPKHPKGKLPKGKLPKIPGWEEPKPIRDDPRAGHHSVVIAFTIPPHGRTPEQHRARILAKLPHLLGYRVGPAEGLYVGVRVVGAGGEKSEYEGTVGL